MAKKSIETTPKEFCYTLAELPSSQHRAGLAGLVLMVDWLARQPLKTKGVCEIVKLDASGLTLRLDRQGMRDLFDQIYATSRWEKRVKTPWKGVEPLRVEEEVHEEKGAQGKKKAGSKTQKIYVYLVELPRGAFVAEFDEAARETGQGPWISLWRNMVWNILRKIPATRRCYMQRLDGGVVTKDADEAWSALQRGGSMELTGSYFLGAHSKSAEGTPFLDLAHNMFLLHFWPFVAQVYVPFIVNSNGDRKYQGFAIAVPDVADLEVFCKELPKALRGRDSASRFVDISQGGALDLFVRLKEQVQQRVVLSDLLSGIDVFHMEGDGQNARSLSTGRVDPDEVLMDAFKMVQGTYWSPVFRRQRLTNLITLGPHWYSGFDRVFSTTPHAQTIGSKQFRHDAREAFSREANMNRKEGSPSIETVVFKKVGIFVSSKIKGKLGLGYKEAKEKGRLGEYRTIREKTAREAFLAARSRSGESFVEFFTATLCSVPHRLNEEEYLLISAALTDPIAVENQLRPLTLLALSALG